MGLPPLIAWYQRLFDTHLVLALLLGLLVLVVAILLFRIALKVFLVFLLLLLIAVGASYLILGEDQTERVLREESQDALGGDRAPSASESPPAEQTRTPR